jgi:bifunctional polynucleotide phosphatase/kinase
LKALYHDEGYRIVVLSNQAGLTLHVDPNFKGPKTNLKERVANFKQKCSAMLSFLDLPITVYAATGKDIYRKPRTGMWTELCKDCGLDLGDVDLDNSIFVGDAGGRMAALTTGKVGDAAATAKDFSCSDRNFAHNVGIKYQTPEEFFLGEKPRDFQRAFDLANFPFSDADKESTASDIIFEKKNPKEVVLFCGPPGAGKSTFYWRCLKPLGYERVNQDILKRYDYSQTMVWETEMALTGRAAETSASRLRPNILKKENPS